MPPKKVAPTPSASKLPTATQPGLAESQVAPPKPAKPTPAPAPEKASKPAPAAVAPKEQAPPKQADPKAESEHTEHSKDAKHEVKPEAVKQVEEPEDPNKPSRWKRIIAIVHKVFLIGIGLVLAGIGAIGYVQLFQGSTWEYAKSSYNVLVSRCLTNFWYVIFGLILWSGVFHIPYFSKFFEFTKQLIGLSIYSIFLGFAIQGGNLDGSSADFALFAASMKTTDQKWLTDLNKIFYYVRGIAGLALIVVGLGGLVYGVFRKEVDEDEEEVKIEKH